MPLNTVLNDFEMIMFVSSLIIVNSSWADKFIVGVAVKEVAAAIISFFKRAVAILN